MNDLRLSDAHLSIDEAQQIIIDNINAAGDVLSQYTYLISLSKQLPSMSENEKASSIMVDKCQSQVWLLVSVDHGRTCIKADSDTLIVRSVLWILVTLLSERTPKEIASAHLRFIAETELADAFSSERTSGFKAIVKTIQNVVAPQTHKDATSSLRKEPRP